MLIEVQQPASISDARAWYVMSAYRVHPKINLGAYFSRYVNASHILPLRLPTDRYSKDWAVSARIDPNRYLYLKLEGHYINGTALGFYLSTNPQHIDPLTRLLVARIGFTF
jgi:hypothetical protein